MRLVFVDLDFDCSTVCRTLLGLMGMWQKWLGSWARWWNKGIKVNPTQVSAHLGLPVCMCECVACIPLSCIPWWSARPRGRRPTLAAGGRARRRGGCWRSGCPPGCGSPPARTTGGVRQQHSKYRVTLVVEYLGWVDLDLGCSTILLGQ